MVRRKRNTAMTVTWGFFGWVAEEGSEAVALGLRPEG